MAISLPIVSKFDDKGINQAENGLDRLTGFAKGAGVAIGAALGAASAAAVALGVSSVKAASDFQETSAAVEQIFGSAAEVLDNFSLTAAKTMGQSQTQFLNGAKTFGIFGKAAGLADRDNAEFSKNLAVLASDLASFNNTDVDTAINAIGAALRGESEPIRQFGVLLDDATLKARAMSMGIYDGTGSLTQQQRVMAAYQEVLAQTTTQQGDFARTSDGLANGSRIIQAMFEDLKITIGNALLPAMLSVIPVIQEFMTTLTESPDFKFFLTTLATTFTDLLNALLPLMEPLTDIILGLLPPLMDLFSLLVPIIIQVVDAFMPLIEGILPPLVDLIASLLPPFMELFSAIITPLVPIVVKLVEAFAPLVAAILPPLLRVVNALVPIFFALIDAFLPLIEELLPPLLDLFLAIVEPLAELLEELLPFLIPMIKGFGDVLKWLIDNMLKPLIEALKLVVGWFAQLFGFDGKSVKVGANVPGVPRAPGVKLAEGGIVMPRQGGTLATIGEGGQAEAVIPLDRFDDIVGKRGGGGIVINVNAGMGTDGAAVGEQIVNAIRRYERTSGAVFARA